MKTDKTQSNLIKPKWGFFVFLIAVATLLRLTPYIMHRFWGMDISPGSSTYLWGFSAVPAIFIFCGARFQNRIWCFVVPFSILVLSDIGIGVLEKSVGFSFYDSQWLVYLCYFMTLLAGLYLRKHGSFKAIAGAGFLSSVVFFLVTNFGFWVSWNEYPMTFDGLMACYTAALPFFRTSLISMAIFLPILFNPMLLRIFQKAPEAKIALETF